MKPLRVPLLLLAGLAAVPATAGVQYFVDPVSGSDVPAGGSENAPWKTVAFAVTRITLLPPASQAGLVLNLRANALYPLLALPSTLHGTPEQPIVIQPYGGARVVFDAGEPRFRQPGAWEPVPGGTDEWRTKDPFTLPAGQRVAWGQMMDTRLRLATYNHLEDLRSANESYESIPADDPRPGLPVNGDPTRKLPFTYVGPGVFYVFEDAAQTVGRVHLRLSSTHMNAPGIQDYVGGGNPNAMSLSLARTSAVAGGIAAQNVVLRNLTFQNGGLKTLGIIATASNVTFDHCEVYGARVGVRMKGGASGIRFHHCLFDGGLAPWTTRSDVKDNVASETADLLVAHAADQSEYVNCAFRRGHDALQIVGHGIEVRDSLFEDLNDEVFQYEAAVGDVRIHGNVVRQALAINSFHPNPEGGPLYFYRNVVDQRVPTRGYRILVPDAPAPYIWRYGSDFKNGATPPFHVYQNTFISSHAEDKGSYVSQMFYDAPVFARTYLNNIHLVLNLDLAFSPVHPASSPARADGNVWYRFHPGPPLFPQPLFTGPGHLYFTLAQLWADFPEWEAHGQHADPRLANFTDEYFDYQVPYPNTDFRPAADGPAAGAGIALPAELPDDFDPGAAHPDVGARPANAPVMAVGIDAATRFPALGVPIADVGPDQTIVDVNGDGFETVTIDASRSRDLDGVIRTYEWTEGGRLLFTTTTPGVTLNLPEGQHYIRVVVKDDLGLTDSDAVKVRVVPLAPGENRLACPGFEETSCTAWDNEGGWVTSERLASHSGARAFEMVQDGQPHRVSQRVPVSPGVYTVSGWLRTQSLLDFARLGVDLVDASGVVVNTIVFAAQRGNSHYAYFEHVVEVSADIGFLEVFGSVAGSGSGLARFDDLRIRDRNLLANGRFEVPARTGQDRPAPGWAFGRGGRVRDADTEARSGRYVLSLEPYELNPQPGNDYHFIEQRVAHVTGSGYRASAWLRRDRLAVAPTFQVKFYGLSGQTLATRDVQVSPGDGQFTYAGLEIAAASVPAGTATLGVVLRLPEIAEGSVWIDDVLVEPLP